MEETEKYSSTPAPLPQNIQTKKCPIKRLSLTA
jgi:hypothetical protein